MTTTKPALPEPDGYYVYIPSQQSGYVCGPDDAQMVDDLTNTDAVAEPLYAQSAIDAAVAEARAVPALPEIDYTELIAACYRTTKAAQGTRGCAQFAKGAEWFRDVVLSASPTPPGAEPASTTTTLGERIAELASHHGSLRSAATALGCDAGYLSRLSRGEKTEPCDELVERMGLRRVVTYQRLTPPASSEGKTA